MYSTLVLLCSAQSGSTSVLVTAVSEHKADSSASWLPLQVLVVFVIAYGIID